MAFRLADAPAEEILAWTTTPWTLPSNVALAVGPELAYVCLERGGQRAWLAEAALKRYAQKLEGWTRAGTARGAELVGRANPPRMP